MKTTKRTVKKAPTKSTPKLIGRQKALVKGVHLIAHCALEKTNDLEDLMSEFAFVSQTLAQSYAFQFDWLCERIRARAKRKQAA